jgi:hypothetical protein
MGVCGRIAQIGQRLPRPAGQAVHGLAVGIGLAVGRQHLLPQADHFITIGIELKGLRRVVVGDQQIAPAFDQAHHRVVHVQRNQAALERAELVVQAGHPGRKARERQRVGHGELDHVPARAGMRAQHGARVLQRLEHFQGLVVQGLAGGGEACGVGAAVHQVGARPGLQRLDAPRERRLGHMPQLR